MACSFTAVLMSVVLCSAMGTAARAQAVNQSLGAATGELEEITVTARRRSEQLEHVPVAVTALTDSDIEERGIKTQADLQLSIPGLLVNQSHTQNEIYLVIRGATVDPQSGSSPAVLSYLNEVSTNVGAGSIYDLSSVQVLKGPQGTLFGRNATGGAVLYTTAKPGDTFGGYYSQYVGNYGYFEEQAAVDLPVSDKVLLRIATDFDNRKGYVYNEFNNTHLGVDDRKSGRVTLLLRPIEGLENTTTLQYDYQGGNNVGVNLWSAYPCGAKNNGIPLETTVGCLYTPSLDATTGIPGAWNQFLAAHPKAYPGGIVEFVGVQRSLGPWVVDQGVGSDHQASSTFISNITTYQLAPDMELKNIAGFSHVHTVDFFDQTGAPYPIQPEINDHSAGFLERIIQSSDELQLSGKALDSKLSYLVGIYYLHNSDIFNPNLELFDVTPIMEPIQLEFNFNAIDQSEALYTQENYDLGSLTGIEGLSVTAGIRYTAEQKSVEQLPGSLFYGAATEHADFNRPSWQIGLEDQIRPDWLLYIESRGGWRSGGFNGTGSPIAKLGEQGGNEFASETTHDVEIGSKFQGHWGAMPARLNIAAYNQWIENVQRIVYADLNGNIGSATATVPAAQITGVELDTELFPAPWLQVGISGAFTNARFTSATTVLDGAQLTYGPYGEAPRVAGTVFGRVKLPTPAELGDMYLRADVYAQSSEYFSSLNNTITPGSQIPGYALLNLRYDWQTPLPALTVSGFAKNVLNRDYWAGGYATGPVLGANGASPGLPRMYGVELHYKF
jgi:iron complex outermembrane receptor protein